MAASRRVHAEDHYVRAQNGNVWDSRIVEGLFTEPPIYHVFESQGEQQQFNFAVNDPFSLPRKIEGDYVNGLTQIRYAGRDGEDASGFMHILKVETPAGEVRHALRSFLFLQHRDGQPRSDTSWVIELDSEAAALELWDRRSFYLGDMFLASEEIEAANPGFSEHVISKYKCGRLQPWYEQTVDKPFLYDNYVLSGEDLATNTEQFMPGQIYRLPQRPWYSNRINNYVARTCLNATQAVIMPRPGNFYDRDLPTSPTEVVRVTWGNGETVVLDEKHADEVIPITVRQLQDPSRVPVLSGK